MTDQDGPQRLDVALVSRGLARSRGQAADLVARGRVVVGGRPATKVSLRTLPGDPVEVIGDDARWVSRAAHKLLGAFEVFGPEGWTVAGMTCLDLGACTGGFTQVLLDRGADHVLALDVGHGQLAPELAADPRVSDLSGRNVRDMTPADLGGRVPRVVGDLSFISLRLVLPAVAGCLTDDGEAVLLVKPQFEVGRSRLGKHGVVGDPAARADALTGVLEVARGLRLGVLGLADSPIHGGEGNIEYLLRLTRRPGVGLAWQAQSETVTALTTTKGAR